MACMRPRREAPAARQPGRTRSKATASAAATFLSSGAWAAMAGGHHGSFAGRFFQVAGLGGVEGAGAWLGVPPLGGRDAAPPEGGTPCGTLAAERAPSASEGEGWGEGEGVGVLGFAEATEPGGFSPSPLPSPVGNGRAFAPATAKAAFSLSGGKEATALAGTVTAMVGGWILNPSGAVDDGAAPVGSLAGRSGAKAPVEGAVLAAPDGLTGGVAGGTVGLTACSGKLGALAAAVGWLAGDIGG